MVTPPNLHLCHTFISLSYFASYAFVRHILTFLLHILAHVAKTADYQAPPPLVTFIFMYKMNSIYLLNQ